MSSSFIVSCTLSVFCWIIYDLLLGFIANDHWYALVFEGNFRHALDDLNFVGIDWHIHQTIAICWIQ